MDVEGGHSSDIFVFLVAGFALFVLLKSERAEPNLKHIPALGRTNYLLSYIDAFWFTTWCHVQLRRGYEKYRTSVFKVATWNRWLVIVSGTRNIEELRKASEDEVSFIGVAGEPDASLYHIGHFQAVSPQYITGLTRNITQNLAFLLPSIKEEITLALNSAIPTTEVSTGWQELDAMTLAANVTTKVVNRVILGSPLTRDEQYTQLSADQARDVYGFKTNILYISLPRAIAALIRVSSNANRTRRRMRKMIVACIRQAKEISQLPPQEENQERANDVLSWTLADASNRTPVEDIASHLLNLSITANQTISMTFAHALYHLAANPKFAAPMRKETERVVAREGWSKHSLEHMRKVDSFVKESMRMSNISSVSMTRKVLQPFTLSDGTQIPEGALVAAAARPRHLDATTYASPDTFDGFRFSKLHELQFGDDPILGGSSSGGMPFQLVTTTADYLVWGYGRHACPGRFFAAVAVKKMLAYVVLHYDVRFEDGVRPRDVVVGTNYLPDPNAKILFRRR